MPWAFVVGLFWVDFGETILDPSHFRKSSLCKDRLTSFASFPKSGCGWKGLGWNALSFCCWFVLGRLWGNHFGPFAFQKVFTFSTLIRLLGEFSWVQVEAQGVGGAPRGEGERGSTPRWSFVLFCLFLFECSTNAFDKVCFSCLQEHLYTLYMFKDVTWISIFKYT